jgi:hypothetical protein
MGFARLCVSSIVQLVVIGNHRIAPDFDRSGVARTCHIQIEHSIDVLVTFVRCLRYYEVC